MKTITKVITVAVILIALLSSCNKSEISNNPKVKYQIDTIFVDAEPFNYIDEIYSSKDFNLKCICAENDVEGEIKRTIFKLNLRNDSVACTRTTVKLDSLARLYQIGVIYSSGSTDVYFQHNVGSWITYKRNRINLNTYEIVDTYEFSVWKCTYKVNYKIIYIDCGEAIYTTIKKV